MITAVGLLLKEKALVALQVHAEGGVSAEGSIRLPVAKCRGQHKVHQQQSAEGSIRLPAAHQSQHAEHKINPRELGWCKRSPVGVGGVVRIIHTLHNVVSQLPH